MTGVFVHLGLMPPVGSITDTWLADQGTMLPLQHAGVHVLAARRQQEQPGWCMPFLCIRGRRSFSRTAQRHRFKSFEFLEGLTDLTKS